MSILISDISKSLPWIVRKSTDVSVQIACKVAGIAKDISAYTFFCEVYRLGGSTPITTAGVVNGGATGIITLTFTDAQLNIPMSGDYIWFLRTTVPTDSVWLNGPFTVNSQFWTGESPTDVDLTIDLGATTIDLEITMGGGGSASALVPISAPITGPYTAHAFDFIPVDTTSGNVTVTIPVLADGAEIGVKHVIRGGTNTVTIQLSGTDVFNKVGGGTTLTLTLANQGVILQYQSSTKLWFVIADDLSLAQLDLRFYPISSNPAGYLTGITSGQVTGALGFTPYNSSNPAGYLAVVALASNVTGILPVANGGNGTATPALVAGANVTITGSWPSQTINASTGGTVATFAQSLAGTNNTSFMSPLQVRNVSQKVFNVEAYGAVHNAQYVIDGAISSTVNTTTLTSASGLFVAGDTGKTFVVSGAGVAGAPLTATGTYVNATTITLSVAASTTVSSAMIDWGADDTIAIQAAITAANAGGGGTVYFPNGIYLIAGALQTSVSGSNPNCQIYLPPSADATLTKPVINLLGESHTNLQYSFTLYPAVGGVTLRTVITGSGTNPVVIGGRYASGSAILENNNQFNIKNIDVRLYTNNGAYAPKVSGIMLRYQGLVGEVKNNSVGPDVPIGNTVTSSGTESFGMWLGGFANNLQADFYANYVTGVKYGYVLSEHIESTLNEAVACNNAALFMNGAHDVRGSFIFLGCVNYIMIQNGTVLSEAINGSKCHIDIMVACEKTTYSKWYDYTTFLTDASNMAYGTVKYNFYGQANTAVFAQTTGGTNLNFVPYESLIGPRFNQAGGINTLTNNAGVTTGINAGVIEANSGQVASTTDKWAVFQAVASQSNTGSAIVGIYQVLNSAIAAADKRLFALTTVTNGATNTGLIGMAVMNAGTLTNFLTSDALTTTLLVGTVMSGYVVKNGTISPTQLTVDTSNWAPASSGTVSFIRMSSNANISVTGMVLSANQVAGREVTLTNAGSFIITLAHEGASSTAANRFSFDGFDFIFNPGATISLIYDGVSSRWRMKGVSSRLSLAYTLTGAGTTGAQTINKPSGSVRFAAAASSLVVTNSLVTANSQVYCSVLTNDTTAILKNIVRTAGSFTINLNAAATAETEVCFLVVNS